MLYFFYGNQSLLELELQKRRQEYLQKNVTVYSFDFSNKEEEAFLQELSMNSMFAEPKAFFIKRAEALKTNSWATILKSMALFDLSEKEILFFYPGKEIGKNMEKEFQKLNTHFISFTEEEQEKNLKQYLENKLALSSYDAEKLLEMLGKDFHKIEQESNKILQFLDGKAFSFEKVLPILSIEKDYNIFTLIDQFLEQEKPAILLEYLQQNPNDIPAILYNLADSLFLLSKITSLLEKDQMDDRVSYTHFKTSFSKIQVYFRGKGGRPLHPYPVYLKIKIAKKYPLSFWLKKLNEILLCEYQFKSGFMDIQMSMEQFILGFYSSSSDIPQYK
ncbi:MAG TPA: hypothetical protein VIG61_01355 [Fusobacterium sp.]|uniref:DNA polymerase III subunit delta n=1 Tax=Fusobacterium sp. TaxID=68766 RepID=UPI002F3F4FFD